MVLCGIYHIKQDLYLGGDMYIDEPKIELSYLAHLSCCVVLKAIRDYRRGIKKQSAQNHFMLIRQKINDIHGQDAIDWFYDRDDSALSFPVCCFLIERALSNKTVVAQALRHKKDGLLFDPDTLRDKIFANPVAFIEVFKELAKKLSHEDVKVDVDEISNAYNKNIKDDLVPVETDSLIFDDCESDADFESAVAVG